MSSDSNLTSPQCPRRTWCQRSKLARVRIAFALMLIIVISIGSWWWPRRSLLTLHFLGARVIFHPVVDGQRTEMLLNRSPAWLARFLGHHAELIAACLETDAEVSWIDLPDSRFTESSLWLIGACNNAQDLKLNENQTGPGLRSLANQKVISIRSRGRPVDLAWLVRLPHTVLVFIRGPLDSDALSGLDDGAQMPNLVFQRVVFTENMLAGLGRMRRFSRSLDFSHCSGVVEGLKHLTGMTQLRGLRIDGSTINDECVGHIVQLRELRSLTVTHDRNSDSILNAISTLPHLEEL